MGEVIHALRKRDGGDKGYLKKKTCVKNLLDTYLARLVSLLTHLYHPPQTPSLIKEVIKAFLSNIHF